MRFSILFVNPDKTGGLRWHWRAWLRRRYWSSTTRQISDWLASVPVRSSQLLLIGGSAGWMMSGRWLQRFERIHLVDLDPLAPLLFRMNHGSTLKSAGTTLSFTQMDGVAQLETLLAAHPQATVFFDNVLGQHRFRVSDLVQAEAELERIALRLQGRDWGSVHDLFSGPTDPMQRSPQAVMSFESGRDAAGLYVEGLRDIHLHRRLLEEVGGTPDWMDHLTTGIFPQGVPTRLMAWQFQSRYAHWLQAGWVSGAG